MRPGLPSIALSIVITSLLIGCSSSKSKPENFSVVAEDDPEMKAAMAKARTTLPDFWRTLAQPSQGESGFALKVPVKDEHGTEFFWVTDLKRQNGTVSGEINNDPEIVHNVKLGDRITVQEEDICDWMYMRGGKIYGNETIHALYKTMSPEEAAQMKKMMANP